MTGDQSVARRIELRTVATSYGTGPFYPAIRDLARIMYWPNITFNNEDDACNYAKRALLDCEIAANDIARQWNIWEV